MSRFFATLHLSMKLPKTTHLFGALEAEIMEILWKRGASSVREVLQELGQRRKIAYTTVMTVMARLFEKGVLRRALSEEGAYVYTPRQKREDLLAAASKKMIADLIHTFGDVAVAQFFDMVKEHDAAALLKWRRKLKTVKE